MEGPTKNHESRSVPIPASVAKLLLADASLPISAGANPKVLQKLMGHKTATITLDRYGHLFPDDLDAVAEALDTAAGDWLRTDLELTAVSDGRNTI